ncbi:hypothetical protein N9E78_00240 [bacterium]|nr:hypothetical protein [bacterium]
MKEMIIMVNLDDKSAYASGNQQFFGLSKELLFENIKNESNHGGNNNFLSWAKSFSTIEQLDYLFIKSPIDGQVKKHSSIVIKGNKWTERSTMRTREKKVGV